MSFNKLTIAKNYLHQRANTGCDESKEILWYYEDILKQAGEFTAAKFILDVYTEHLKILQNKEVIND